ncbi:MAG: LysE family translocator [Gammaproteobacteria bacterium]|nr:LysE family translocator [Gammaproteobacteria bacterium]
MPSAESMLMVTLAGLALSASPGPSMLYVLSRSIGQHRRAGLYSAAGLAIGGIVHAIAAAAGLSVLVSYYPTMYRVIAALGAGYLIYLGVQMFLARNERIGGPTEVAQEPPGRILLQGILVEVLNPKTALFFIAFLPQFIDYNGDGVMLQVLILGMLIPLTAIPSDLLVAFTGGTVARRISDNDAARRTLNCLGAVLLIALGLRLILSEIG